MTSEVFTAKKGTSLTELHVKLFDRDNKGLDLTDATSVLFYLRKEGADTNLVDGLQCTILDPVVSADETYPQRVQGPDVALSDTGWFRAYYKAAWGPHSEWVPSEGYLWLRVESTFEA